MGLSYEILNKEVHSLKNDPICSIMICVFLLFMLPLVKCTEFLISGTCFSLSSLYQGSLRKKKTIHQVSTMLATSKNVLFPGHYHLLTTDIDNPTLIIAQAPASQ